MWPKTKSLYNLYIAIVLLQFALFIQKVFHDALICRFLHFLSGLDVKVLLWKDNVLVAHPLKDFFMSLIWNWKFTWYAAVFALIFSNVYIYTLPKKNTSKTSLSKVQWEEWKLQKIISTTYVKYSFQKQRKWSLLVTSNESKTSNHVSTKSEIIRTTKLLESLRWRNKTTVQYWNEVST